LVALSAAFRDVLVRGDVPKLLELVERSRARQHDVDDDVSEINE
jgi:hypothetical protein